MRHRFTVLALGLLIACGLCALAAVGTATPAASSARDDPGGPKTTAVTGLAGWPTRQVAPCRALPLTNAAGSCQSIRENSPPRRAVASTGLERLLAGGDVAADHFARPGAAGGAQVARDAAPPTLAPTPFRRARR